jgi:hypothetical protein
MGHACVYKSSKPNLNVDSQNWHVEKDMRLIKAQL